MAKGQFSCIESVARETAAMKEVKADEVCFCTLFVSALSVNTVKYV
jgi:hypothetical protein